MHRAAILEAVRSAHNSGGVKIWIKNYRRRLTVGEVALVTYEEWQREGDETRGRLSSALFRAKPGTPNQFGLFFYGPNQTSVPFGNGILCVSGQLQRLSVSNSGSQGVLVHALDITSPPTGSGQILAGSTWNFQAWYRDPAAGGQLFNTSDGLTITFTS